MLRLQPFPLSRSLDHFFSFIKCRTKIPADILFAFFFFGFDGFPGGEDFVGTGYICIPEHVGVPSDHLVPDSRDHVIERENTLFLGNLRLDHDLKEQVAELFLQVFGVARRFVDVDSADDLRRLFDACGFETGVSLRPVPRASVLRTESADDFL